ncbi:MAG TPA: hypothetical protein VK928_13270, partial [Longimicrobiales bacterium]|nr:hypothetical protein [Longimicrobiales bacterium]
MNRSMRTSPIFLITLLLAAAALVAPRDAAAQKTVLDHDAYEVWDTIGGATLSRDGQWVLYHRLRYDRDGSLVVRATSAATEHVFARGTGGSFDAGSGYVVFTIRAARDSVLAARRARRRPDQMPKDTLAILELATGRVTKVPATRSFSLPEEGGGWLAYQLERPGPAPAAGGANAPRPARTKENGSPLVIRELATGNERRVDDVASFTLSRDGRRLAFAISNPDSLADGVHVMDVATGNTTEVLGGEGEVRRLVFDRAGEQLAFLANRDEWRDTTIAAPAYALYHWQAGQREARRVAGLGTQGMPAGWTVSDNGAVSFSHSGARLLVGTAPRP